MLMRASGSQVRFRRLKLRITLSSERFLFISLRMSFPALPESMQLRPKSRTTPSTRPSREELFVGAGGIPEIQIQEQAEFSEEPYLSIPSWVLILGFLEFVQIWISS